MPIQQANPLLLQLKYAQRLDYARLAEVLHRKGRPREEKGKKRKRKKEKKGKKKGEKKEKKITRRKKRLKKRKLIGPQHFPGLVNLGNPPEEFCTRAWK